MVDYAIFLVLGCLLILSLGVITWSGVSIGAVDSATPDSDFTKGTCNVIAVRHSARRTRKECFDCYTYTYSTAEEPGKRLVSTQEKIKRKDFPTFWWSGFAESDWDGNVCDKDADDVKPSKFNAGDDIDCWSPVVSGGNGVTDDPVLSAVYGCQNDGCIKLHDGHTALATSKQTATWCLWAFGMLTIGILIGCTWACLYRLPEQGPLDYIPIADKPTAETNDDSDIAEYSTKPRTVTRERSWTDSAEPRDLKREISDSFKDFSFVPQTIDPDTARRAVQKGFLVKVYVVLVLQLAVTWGCCYLSMKNIALQTFLLGDSNGVPNAVYVVGGSWILAFVILIALHFLKNQYPWNGLLLGAFTICLALMISVTCARFEADGMGHIVLFAWGLTMTVFITLTLLVTFFPEDWDLSWLGIFCFISLNILVLCGLFALIFGVPLGFWYTIPGVIIFTGYIIFDSFMIMNKMGPDDWVIACIDLYLDILNLFVLLLSILSSNN